MRIKSIYWENLSEKSIGGLFKRNHRLLPGLFARILELGFEKEKNWVWARGLCKTKGFCFYPKV